MIYLKQWKAFAIPGYALYWDEVGDESHTLSTTGYFD